MPRLPLLALTLATGCPPAPPSAEHALDGVVLPESIAYPDSWFEGQVQVVEGWDGELRCRWLAEGTLVGEGTPDAAGTCSLDGLLTKIPEEAWLVLRVEALRDGAVVDQLDSGGLWIRAFPVGAVTELRGGCLAFVDSGSGAVQERLDLILAPEESGVDTTSGASSLAGLPMQVRYTPERDKLLVTSSTYGVIWEIDPATREILDYVQPSSANYWIEFSQDASRIFMVDRGAQGVSLLDRDYAILASTPTGTGPIMLWNDAQYGRVYVVHHNAAWVSVVDDETLEPLGRIEPARGSYHVAPGPDGETLWIVTEFDDSVSVYDRDSNALLASVTVGDLPNYIHFLGDGSEAYVTSFHDGEIARIDTESLTVLRTVDTSAGSVAIVPRDDGRFVYVPNVLGDSISVIDTRTDAVVDMIYGVRGPRWIQWIDPEDQR